MTWVPALLNDLDLVARSALILSVENEARSPPNSEATAGIPIRSARGGLLKAQQKEAVAMFNVRRGGLIVAAMLAVCASSVSAQSETPKNLLQSTQQVPNTFGTQDYSVTTVSAVGFYPEQSGFSYQTSGSKGRFGAINTLTEFYATVDIPSGAVIDFIGLNSITDTAFAYGVNLLSRDAAGNLASVGTFSSSVHGWGTDYNATPIGYTWTGKNGNALFINVEQASNPNLEFFGWVEVWWKRSVSPAPATATFTDVPTSNPFFQFVEALAASGVTAGCGGGNFCPNAPLTRGQMAVFLSKALGLHWPGN